jgi:2-polyprenyl-3-methyl-5-hydroxy-6-metoxy-1,4-benzoquinol methylase
MNIQQLLIDNGIIFSDSIHEYASCVRDSENIKVFRCSKSGVIFLQNSNHITDKYYADKAETTYWRSDVDRKDALKTTRRDDLRRFLEFAPILSRKKFLDIGTGMGGILDLASNVVSSIAAVEPISYMRTLLMNEGYTVYDQIDSISKDEKFDVISLFHVLEHIPDPSDILSKAFELLEDGGKIIVEVPHSKDILLETLQLESFKKFTLWSEHLVLHTRQSLNLFLSKSGFKNIVIKGVQRYSISNHLHWLVKGKPGGHINYSHLETDRLRSAYEEMLASIDQTDTLLLIAEK